MIHTHIYILIKYKNANKLLKIENSDLQVSQYQNIEEFIQNEIHKHELTMSQNHAEFNKYLKSNKFNSI